MRVQIPDSALPQLAASVSPAMPSYWTEGNEAGAVSDVQLIELPLPGQEGNPDLPPSLSPSLYMRLVKQVPYCHRLSSIREGAGA